jgi:PAS domain S-box-containing protein
VRHGRGDGRIVTWNGSAERITGYPAREAIGKPCCELFGGHDECGNRLCYRGCHVMTLVKMSEAVRSFDTRTRTKRGHPVWLNISVLAVPAALRQRREERRGSPDTPTGDPRDWRTGAQRWTVMVHKILVPVDCSSDSEAVLDVRAFVPPML